MIEHNGKRYEERMFYGYTVKQVVTKLLAYAEQGILIYVNFNGHTLYSDTVTYDNAHQEIVGMSMNEFYKKQDESYKRLREHIEDFKEAIPDLTTEWIEKGKAILSKDKWESWERIVPIRLNDLYEGFELKCTLEIEQSLQLHKSLKVTKTVLDNQEHSGLSYSLIKEMIKEFCNRGQEFIDYLEKGE